MTCLIIARSFTDAAFRGEGRKVTGGIRTACLHTNMPQARRRVRIVGEGGGRLRFVGKRGGRLRFVGERVRPSRRDR
jgi:hypothetical protein